MTFGELRVGDVVTLMGVRSVVLAIQKPHPLNMNFHLIIWWIFDEKRLSFDMLHPDYAILVESLTAIQLHEIVWTQATNEKLCR